MRASDVDASTANALANEFALALLMPEREFRAEVARRTTDSVVDVAAVAARFRVTTADAHARGVSLGLLRAW